jgi:hypothetical protein
MIAIETNNQILSASLEYKISIIFWVHHHKSIGKSSNLEIVRNIKIV